jgi:hypothetical protein
VGRGKDLNFKGWGLMKIVNLLILLLGLLLSSCLSEVGDEQDGCESNEIFDTKSKSCVNILYGNNSTLGLSISSQTPYNQTYDLYKSVPTASENQKDFFVDITSPTGIKYTLKWFLDGVEVATVQNSPNEFYNIDADLLSTGAHTLDAVLYNQQYEAEEDKITWNFNVNYAPVSFSMVSPVTVNYYIYEGESELFSVTSESEFYTIPGADEGTEIRYEWELNGNSVGANSSSFTFTPLDHALTGTSYHLLIVRAYATDDSTDSTYTEFGWAITLFPSIVPTVGAAESFSFNETVSTTINITNEATDNRQAFDQVSPLEYVIVDQPTRGQLDCSVAAGTTFIGDLICEYTPSANYHGVDSFTYLAKVQNTSYESAVTTITLNGVDDTTPAAPTATSFSVDVPEDAVDYEIDLSGYSWASDGALDTCAYTNVSETALGASGCSCTAGSCSVHIDVTPNYNSEQAHSFSFTYTVTDDQGAPLTSASATVTVNVTPVSDPPVLGATSNMPATITQGDTSFGSIPTALATDADIGDGTSKAEFVVVSTGISNCGYVDVSNSTIIATQTTTGTFGIVPSLGKPDFSDFGDCYVRYRVVDENGIYISSEQSFTLTVGSANVTLDATPPNPTVGEGSSGVIVTDGSIKVNKETATTTYGEYKLTQNSCEDQAAGGPKGVASIDAVTGEISLDLSSAVDVNYAGTCHITYYFADDRDSGSDLANQTLIVTVSDDTSDPPVFKSWPALNYLNTTPNSDAELTFQIDEDAAGTGSEDSEAMTVQIAVDTVNSSNVNVLDQSSVLISYAGGPDGPCTDNGNDTITCPVGDLANDVYDSGADDIVITFPTNVGQDGDVILSITLEDENANVSVETKSLTINSYVVHTDHMGWEKINAYGPVYNLAGTMLSNSSVELEWESMTVTNTSGGVVASNDYVWELHRSDTIFTEIPSPGDATRIDCDPSSASEQITNFSTTSCTDTTAVSGERYYYAVIPVGTINSGSKYDFPILYQNSASSVILPVVITPPDNMVLVHRWMANKEICEGMGLTPDIDDYYRCAYTGVDSIAMSTLYDISNVADAHLLVDKYEVGCPYTLGGCDGGDDCVGIDHNNTDPDASGNYYYDRQTATCYESTGTDAADWGAVSLTSIGLKNSPPVVNIAKVDAGTACTVDRVTTCNKADCSGTQVTANPTVSIPTRLEQIAFSAWDSSLSSGSILSLRSGGADNCNTIPSNGLSYSDSKVPFVGDWDTLPGTSTLGSVDSRAVNVGSTATQDCTSRYGVQDAVGNVREWSGTEIDTTHASDSPAYNATIAFDGTDGSLLTSPAIYTGAGLIHYASGLPIVESTIVGAVAVDSASTYGYYMERLNSGAVTDTFLFGGGWDDSTYTTGSESGRFSFDVVQVTTAAPDIGFRCVIRISE